MNLILFLHLVVFKLCVKSKFMLFSLTINYYKKKQIVIFSQNLQNCFPSEMVFLLNLLTYSHHYSKDEFQSIWLDSIKLSDCCSFLRMTIFAIPFADTKNNILKLTGASVLYINMHLIIHPQQHTNERLMILLQWRHQWLCFVQSYTCLFCIF